MEGSQGSRNPFVVGKTVIQEGGVKALYKGLSAGILRQLTYGMSRLGIFRSLTDYFSEGGKKKLDLTTNTACSIVAGAAGALIGTPADAALVRMQADATLPVAERRNYKNGLDAMVRMYREEGLRGFFAGANPTILRGLAINIGMLASYDKLKDIGGQYLGGPNSSANLLCASLGSGVIAATIALPFDFLKTRLQKMKRLPDGTYPYKGIIDAAGKIAKNEGLMAFYAGYPTFLVRIAPHIALTWMFMEALNGIHFLK